MALTKKIHVISFDVPYPPNYGGVIDVFHKIKVLKANGISVILHCFDYGRGEQQTLNEYCEQVYYYPRIKKWYHLLSLLPFIVRTRISSELKNNLLKDDYPILFEALHSCFLLQDIDFLHRKKIFRESNIEHQYYWELSRQEKKLARKIYFWQEAIKLRWFETRLKSADLMLVVSESETSYFRKKFPGNSVHYLPSFHGNKEIKSKTGQGDYLLYHAKLSVAENHHAAMQLIDKVFSKISYSVYIAGMSPFDELKEKVNRYPNIQLIENPSPDEMENLVINAQLHCLYTDQGTGLKLKLINVLFKGRFILLNDKMLNGVPIPAQLFHVENNLEEWKKKIDEIMRVHFSVIDIEHRKNSLSLFNDELNSKKMIQWIWSEN